MIDRIKELVELLNEANEAYYFKDTSIISNKEYDSLYDELVKLEETTGIVLSNSPTQSIGDITSSMLEKVAHASPMLSLDKTKDREFFKLWLGSKEGILSWKLDGLTVVLTYYNGELKSAVTRGNGTIGEDVTENVKRAKNVPLNINYKGELVLRGEAVISYSDFEKLNTDGKYKNPRNLASGSVRLLDTKQVRSRSLQVVIFQCLTNLADTWQERMKTISDNGFTVVEHIPVTGDNVVKAIAQFERRIEDYDIPSDGLVITYNDIAYGESLGRTAKFPKHSFAFKWKDEVAETILRDVEWNVSRTGLINPVAIFDTVELEGTEVSRASLNNISYIRQLKLGIGDTITVYKANMIVPQIDENLTMSDNLVIPDVCPSCGGSVEQIKDNISITLHCTNPRCKAKCISRLAHFVSKEGMNIKGLSEQTLEFLHKKGWVNDCVDLYNLSQYKTKWMMSTGFSKVSVEKILKAIEDSKKTDLQHLLVALGIPNVGVTQAKTIFKDYKTWEEFDRAIQNRKVIKYGNVVGNNIMKWYQESKDDVEKLLSVLDLSVAETETKEQKLKGKTFCITGTLNKYTRKSLTELLESYGAKVTGSVTSKTSYLINNDINSSSSKNQDAKAKGIPIITEDEVNRLIAL